MPHPKIDSRWGHDAQIVEYETFFQKVDSTFYLKSEVHQDVHGHWNVIKSLVELSYYQYEFIDLAVQKALMSLELAMKLRHKEIENNDWAYHKTMKPLLYWFFKRGYFETDHKEYIDRIDWMRNNYSHPKMHSFGGPFISHNIYSPLNMINDLYEDRGLRKERNNTWDRLQVVFDRINNHGGLMRWENKETFPIYFAAIEFVNNKRTPAEIHVAYRVPFTLPNTWKKGDSCQIHPAQELSFHGIEVDKGFIKGKTIDTDTQFTIEPFTEENKIPEFVEWKKQYTDFAMATMHYLAIASPIHSRGHELIKEFYLQ
ncbi:MAG: hypothetical protein EPO58_15735 [Chitinophagaceae bacterium]|nr:MAG: hypothetical protein EPO58_15735 [Chitinophagaceae bacterium]